MEGPTWAEKRVGTAARKRSTKHRPGCVMYLYCTRLTRDGGDRGDWGDWERNSLKYGGDFLVSDLSNLLR